jgi:transglutaminase-like putative cysteine protease
MAGMNPTLQRPAARRMGNAAINAPRMLMSWEDWLTFAAALVAFIAVAVSIQESRWVPGMPPVVPTMMAGLAAGFVAARVRFGFGAVHLAALAFGAAVVLLAVQSYADGANIADRLADTRLRLIDWFHVVRANEISNDRLPFVAIVQAVCFLAAYIASYAIYRWQNPWIAILPGGVVLLANVALARGSVTGALVVFLFGAMLLIARLHLQRLQRQWKRERVEYPEFISIDAGQLTLGLLAALVLGAWLLPSASETKSISSAYDAVTSPFTGRSGAFDRLFHNITGRSGGRLHDFSDFLPIRGDVTLGTRQLYEVLAPDTGFIRGASYDEYTGNGWKVSDREKQRVEGGEPASGSADQDFASRVGITLQVTVIDPDDSILTFGVPVGTNETTNAFTGEGIPWDVEELDTARGLREGDVYNSVGSVSVASAEELRGAGTQYPPEIFERYTQLPGDVPERVGEEAVRVAGGATNPFDAAIALEDYIRSFPYATNVPATPHNRDAVDFFLFDLRSGYFDYTATAMAVMLRELGIPARVAVGYVLDPADGRETSYIVRRNDAYTWVEVFFPGYGWVEFNPTADQPGTSTGGGLDPSIINQDGVITTPELEDIFDEIGVLGGDAGEVQGALQQPVTERNDPPWTLIYSLIGALVAMAALAFAGRVTWNWGLSGLEGPARLWARVERMAGWAKLGGGREETPREFADRVGRTLDADADAATLRRAYERARYGPPEISTEAPKVTEEVDSAYVRVRNALFKLIPKVRVPGRRPPVSDS